MALTHALSTNNYGPNHLIVATSAANGTHTSLATAMADAVSGDTIFLRNSVTENVTLTPGVNITADANSGLTPNISITGTLTMTGAGSCTISNIRLTTNSTNIIVVSGSAASILYIENCFLNCTNTTGISMTTSNAAAQIRVLNCLGDLGTTGIGFHSSSSAGSIVYEYCHFANSGSSVTANTNSAGLVNTFWCLFGNQFSTSSTGGYTGVYTEIAALGNTTALTANGSGTSGIFNCILFSGSASTVSVGSGATLVITECEISSTNTNAITGAGTVDISSISFINTSNTINTTTFTRKVLLGAEYRGRDISTAPSAGMIGEQIRNTFSSVSLSSPTLASVATITLTPGIWDISMMCYFAITGSTTSQTISINNSVANGTIGDNYALQGAVAIVSLNSTMVIPAYRVSLSASTTYNALAGATFSTGSASVSGRISAVRVA